MSEPIQLHFIEKGAGFPLILLHGNGESGAYFERQIDGFAAHARVIALDTRGHGASPRGDAPFTLDQFAEDLHAFLQARGILQADLLGFSDGANIALLFALRHPGCVRKLVLNGGNLSPLGVRLIFQAPICLSYWLVSLLALVDPKARPKKEMLRLMVHEPHIAPEALGALQLPTLVIAGTHDLIRTSHTKAMAQAIPHSQLCLLDGDHFVANKKPEAFYKVVRPFLWGKAAPSVS